jgi:Lon protease-like protein
VRYLARVRRLPLFPLPLVLLPGAPLPLHIFEPRYRRMLADCLAGDREFGILYLPPNVGERELTPGHVGCVARITDSALLDDGRSNVVVTGVARFTLVGYVDSDAPYHVGQVREFADAREDGAPLAAAGARVRHLFGRVGRAARALSDDDEPVPALPDDDTMLSFAVASHIDLDAPARQRLVESRSPTGRLAELESLLAAAVAPLERRAAVHGRAKSNGHGPHAEE